MANITELGLSKGVIVETIVSTYNADGQANAAPMGATMTSPQQIVLRVYTSSLTCKNLQSKKCGVMNITSDPELFYRTAFKEANPNGAIPQNWFEKSKTVNAPKMPAADAYIEVTIAHITPLDAERAAVLCDVRLVQATNVLPKAYCRALFATIEAIVHATRVEAFITLDDNKKRERALELLETISECHNVVNRVAPNSRYSEIMADLSQRINSLRASN